MIRLQFKMALAKAARCAVGIGLWLILLTAGIVAVAADAVPPANEAQSAVDPKPAAADLTRDPQPAFEAANKLYEEGKFTEAAAAYESLLQSGFTSAALYFNLGNARFKAGRIGPALAAYHRAAALDPRDPDIRANLQFARNQVQGPTYKTVFYERWLNQLTLNEWSLLAAGFFWAFFILLALRQFRPALRPLTGKWTFALLVAALFTGSGLGTRLWNERHAPVATVVTSDAVVRHGPLSESQPAFTLHDGAEVKILDRKDDWLQVTTDPQRVGWLTRDNLTR